MKKICPQCSYMMEDYESDCPNCRYHFQTVSEKQAKVFDDAMERIQWEELKAHAADYGVNPEWPKRSRLMAAILAFILGAFGADDLYLGCGWKSFLLHITATVISIGLIGMPWGIFRGIMYLSSDEVTFQTKYKVRV